MDTREEKDLASAFVRSDMDTSLTTVNTPGVQTVTDSDGKKCKALWAPLMDSYDSPCCLGGRDFGDRDPGPDYLLVLLDGPEKGTAVRYSSYGSTPCCDQRCDWRGVEFVSN